MSMELDATLSQYCNFSPPLEQDSFSSLASLDTLDVKPDVSFMSPPSAMERAAMASREMEDVKPRRQLFEYEHSPTSSSSHTTPISPLKGDRISFDTISTIDSMSFDLSGGLRHPSSSPTSSSSSGCSDTGCLPSFEFDGHRARPSELVASSSSTSSLASSAFSPQRRSPLPSNFSPDAFLGVHPDRPELKRRRTAPDVLDSPSSVPSTPTSRLSLASPVSEKKGNGKDGENVWPTDVEEAFDAALRIIPKLGRRKVMVNGKPCGRNELIADYIRRKTGKVRSRKQVSSHIQVLKNLRKNDAEFMRLVSEPIDGEETFGPSAAAAFFGQMHPPSSSPMVVSFSENLLSPQAVGPSRRLTASPSAPALSPGLSTDSLMQSSIPMSAASSLTLAMKDMHFPMPPAMHDRAAQACPFAPASFCMWGEHPESDATHTFVKLEKPAGASVGPSTTIYLEDITLNDIKFPGLSSMNDHLPCQFLHINVNLNLPTNADPYVSQLHANLQLTALQDLNLTAVTSIYSYGTQVLSLEEPMAPAQRIVPTNNLPSHITELASAPGSPVSPMASDAGSSPTNSLRHKFAYNVPFASDFWGIFLRGAFSADPAEGATQLPSFAKVGDERTEFAMAISGLSVIQEFVVRSDDHSAPLVEGRDISPGSALGDVVLVLSYDFECDDANAGGAALSFLAKRKEAPVARPIPPAAPVAGPLARVQSGMSKRPSQGLSRTKSSTNVPLMLGPIGGGLKHAHQGKPNLSLNIPPAAAFTQGQATPGANGPITPLPQMLHTPTMPPPMQGPTSPALRERLGQIWATTSSDWNMASPALMGAFPSQDERLPPPGSQAMHSITANAIAAGTPTLATFPPLPQGQGHGTPFITPNASSTNLSKMQSEESYFSQLFGAAPPRCMSATSPAAASVA